MEELEPDLSSVLGHTETYVITLTSLSPPMSEGEGSCKMDSDCQAELICGDENDCSDTDAKDGGRCSAKRESA